MHIGPDGILEVPMFLLLKPSLRMWIVESVRVVVKFCFRYQDEDEDENKDE